MKSFRKTNTTKIVIIILSVLLAVCIGLIIFFVVGMGKNHEQKTVSQVEEVSSQDNLKEESQETDEVPLQENTIVLTEDYSWWNEKCSPELVLVNAANKLPESYKVTESDYCGVKINSIIKEPLNKMIETGRREAGVNLWLSSSYRDIKTQTSLYNEEVRDKLAAGHPQKQAEALAAMEVARPGYSEHNAGLAVDFNGVSNNFKSTEEYKWLVQNSYKFGFVLRYPEEKKDITGIIFEPWHFRFVGVDVATEMKEKNICLEEYVSSKK